MRTLVVLLCALYVVAPLWHVCELSGARCEHEHDAQSSTRLAFCADSHQELAHTELAHHSSHHDAELCVCPAHARQEKPVSSEVSSRDADFSGTCLARLLSVTPSQISTSFAFAPLFALRAFVALSVVASHSVSSQPQPPVRGPPFSF